MTGRTTNFSRTIATLQGVLTGLYPQAAEPIPVATASDVDEIMFANVTSCERLADVMKQARYDLRGEGPAMWSWDITCLLSRAVVWLYKVAKPMGVHLKWQKPQIVCSVEPQDGLLAREEAAIYHQYHALVTIQMICPCADPRARHFAVVVNTSMYNTSILSFV